MSLILPKSALPPPKRWCIFSAEYNKYFIRYQHNEDDGIWWPVWGSLLDEPAHYFNQHDAAQTAEELQEECGIYGAFQVIEYPECAPPPEEKSPRDQVLDMFHEKMKDLDVPRLIREMTESFENALDESGAVTNAADRKRQATKEKRNASDNHQPGPEDRGDDPQLPVPSEGQ
jgi:hypothetical protein